MAFQNTMKTINAGILGSRFKHKFETIGRLYLARPRLVIFVNFMTHRFPNESSSEYIAEWAQRFLNNTEWTNADDHSKKVLMTLDPKKYLVARDKEGGKN